MANKKTELRYLIYQDKRGEFRWHLLAGNNRKVAESGEGYVNREDCLAAIQLVQQSRLASVEGRKK